MPKEAKARIRINKLLEEADWRFFDTPEGKANVLLETNTKLTEEKLNDLGENFEKTKNGFVDFLLLDESGFSLIVLEAKKEDRDPLTGKEQAREYARSLNVRFVILSNGNLHYFWDIQFGNPDIITKFPSLESIKYKKDFNPNPQNLLREKIEHDYIAITQKPDYQNNPDWKNPDTKQDFIAKNKLKLLRYYQINAIKSIQDAVKQGKSRFLFEMATGTGKTLVAAGVIKLFLRSGNAKRVLFLVDRLELEEQARKNFILYLRNDYKTVIYKENREDWIRAEIVISTVQSLLFNNKYKDLFSPTDFDLVISDEAHRSINGSSRALFEYFTGYKLGLTATPKDYLKKIDREKLAQKDPRQLERRQLLDTYITFGCKSADPTFRYTLLDGVRDGYLVNPIVIDARTEITTQLLSDEGYSVYIEKSAENEEENKVNEDKEVTFYQKDFEKKFFSQKTSMTFCKTFLENALTDPITGEIGKSIVFCVSQNHASKITQILNNFAHNTFPKKYNSDFAVQVTSLIPDAQRMTINFANNNLNGHTKFMEGYKSSKTRVCVTVGMMTTGYDCEDILNLCLMRPVFSPTYFVQMKGRGTRKYTFNHQQKKEIGKLEKYSQQKTNFKLFDFFAVCEYFEEKYNYDEVIKLPPTGGGKGPTGDPPPVSSDEYKSIVPDPLFKLNEKPIGAKGMKVDRKLFEKFEETVKSNSYIMQSIENGKFKEAEEHIKKEVFNKPEDYFDLDKLRKSVNIDRRLSLREILEKIFGKIKKFKTKDELLEEEVNKFISIYHPEPKMIYIIRQFIKAYILDNQLREIIDKGEFQDLATNPRFDMKDMQELGREWREKAVEYIKDYVPLNTFTT
jgi:type I restriction enzyme R subunit